jgi:ribosomal protein L12E/L44/L45/RPP1/RPP2
MGGFLSVLIGIATAIAALAGGGAAIANSVISAKHQKTEEEEEETKRHNAEIEKNSSKSKNCKYWCWFKKIRNRAIM